MDYNHTMITKTHWGERLTIYGTWMSVGAVLLVSVALLRFALPVADDYCRGALDANWLDFVTEQYLTWTGRWAAMSATCWCSRAWICVSWFYPATLAGIYLACALACYGALRTVFAEALGRPYTAMLGAILFAMYWAGMPDPGETVYFLTGAVEYALPFALGVFVVCLLARVRGWGGAAAAGALTLLATGVHEIAAISLTVIIGVGAATAWRTKSPARDKWVAVLACTLVGTAITVLAPGNGMRIQDDFAGANPHGVGTALKVTILQITTYIIPWFLDPKLLAASVLLVASPWFRRAMPRWVQTHAVWWRVAIPAAWFLSVGLVLLAVAWAVGALGPARLYNFLYGLFLLGWIATLFVWSRDLASASDGPLGSRARLVASLAFALAC